MKAVVLEQCARSVLEFDQNKAQQLARKALSEGLDPVELLDRGFAEGLREVGEAFEKGDLFLPELMAGAGVMNAAAKVLEPEIIKRGAEVKSEGKVVLGTVEGDIHDIGKNIVAIMLRAAGFEVVDLGVDVPAQKFVTTALETESRIIGASALLTTTMGKQRELVEAIRQQGLQERIRVMVGGAPTTVQWAQKIGADGYAVDAVGAVKLARSWTE